MKNAIKITLTIAVAVIVLDMFGFMAWAMSGQRPVDNFYVGSITTHALRAMVSTK